MQGMILKSQRGDLHHQFITKRIYVLFILLIHTLDSFPLTPCLYQLEILYIIVYMSTIDGNVMKFKKRLMWHQHLLLEIPLIEGVPQDNI